MSTVRFQMSWLVLLATFAITLGIVIWLARMWRDQWSAQARAQRRRVQSLVGQSQGPDMTGLLLKPMAVNSDHALQAWLQELPGYQRLEQWLLRTRSDRTPVGFVLLDLGLLLGGWLLASVLQRPLQQALALAALMAAAPWLLQWRRDWRQRRQFEAQFPEALDYLSRALRAGQGLSSSLTMVGQEFADPVGREFKKTVDEINFGLDFADALHNMAHRVRSTDLDFFVVAIVIQRESGGNLAELLGGLAQTVRERMKLAGKVRVISAEGRLSGAVLGCLPFILAGLLTTLNPAYMAPLWQSEQGLRLVTVGLVMMALGGLWIWKIVRVRV